MGYREQLGDEEESLILLKSKICACDVEKSGLWRLTRLTEKSARLVLLWQRRVSSKLGDLLRKVCDNLEQNFQQQNDNSMIDYVLSACINTRDKCHLCKMKEKRRRKGRADFDPRNARFAHSAQCQSWAASIVAHRSLQRLESVTFLADLRRLLARAMMHFLDDDMVNLEILGGDFLPESIKRRIVQLVHQGTTDPVRSVDLRRLGTAVYLLHESLYLLLGGDNEEPYSWSPLSFLSRVFLLKRTLENLDNQKNSIQITKSPTGSCLLQCAYTWPWVAISSPDQHVVIHDIDSDRRINLEASSGESLSASDGIVSFCVTKSFVVTIHNGDRRLPPYFENRSNSSSPTDYTSEEIELPRDFEANRRSKKSSPVSSSLRVFCVTSGVELYKLSLSELDYDYDLDDQPIRLFLFRDDQVLLSIERDNFERPSIHQEKGVLSLKLSTDKSQVEIESIDTEVGQGALLEFFAHAERVLSIWHPVSHVGAPLKRKHEHFDIFKASLKSNSESVILPVDAEIVQIKSTSGHVTRAVSPRVTPKSYKNSRKCKTTFLSNRRYKINELISHFCEISHADRLLRVSEASGKVLLELSPDSALHWEKKDSRILGADCRWPLLILVVEYEETVWTFNGEEQTQFQTVLLANIQNRHLSDVRVLDVSRNDSQLDSYRFASLDILLENRVPHGTVCTQLPVRLRENSAQIVYADHTIVHHNL